jgi:hypothetical protein
MDQNAAASSPDPEDCDGDSLMVDETQDYSSAAYSQDFELEGSILEEQEQLRTKS